MDVTLALLADAANLSVEGKLNLLGIFNTVYAPTFPASHPQMQLVLQFRATPAEVGRKRTIEVEFRDADGKKLGSTVAQLVVPKGEPGHPIQVGHIIAISGLRLEKPGDYEFHILVDRDDKEQIPLKAMLATRSQKR